MEIKFYDCNQENLNKVYADYIKKVDGDETRCICTNVLCVVPYTQPKINNGRPSEYIKTDYKMMTSTLLISWKDGAETINKKPYIQFNFGNISQSSIVKFARMEDINWDLEQAVEECVDEDKSDDELYAIHFEKWNKTGECPSELEAKIDAKFGITGRDSNGKPSNGYCDWKKDVFTNGPSIYSFAKLGMDYQKEQMMKDAVEVKVFDDWKYGRDADLITQPAIKLRCPELKIGEKAKVIIIKD